MPILRANADGVRRQISRLERHLNGLRMIPATGALRNRIILALLSKALTVGRAICALVETGFPAEAFGMSRTLIDIFFCVRYMSNKDTEKRAITYAQYEARIQQEWVSINNKYFPNRPLKLASFHEEAMKIAVTFKSKHQWTGHGGQAKMMALEPDRFEKNEQGEPITGEFDYDAFYFWTSHYVHATVKAIEAHAVEPGEVFRIPSRISDEKDYSRLALFNVLVYLNKTFIQACHAMHEKQPEEVLQDMFRMMKKCIRKKQKSP